MDKKEYKREYDRRKYEEAKPAYEALMSCYPLTLDDLPGEQWRDIEGYGGVYQVSTFGRVKSFWKKTPLIRTPVLVGEYLNVDLSTGGKQKSRRKPEVNHDDGNKFNCHVSNLYWATRVENMQHAFDTGLAKSAQGCDDFNAKIKNEADIIYIRDNPDNLSRQELAEKYVVDPTTIGLIQLGKTYENARGNIRKPQKQRIPDEIRAKIRADWATGLYTKAALARKFGCDRKTIRRVINEPAA